MLANAPSPVRERPSSVTQLRRSVPARIDRALEEPFDDLQLVVVAVREDLPHRCVHPRVEPRHLPAASRFEAKQDTTPIDRVALACDPRAALETVDDPRRCRRVERAAGCQHARAERAAVLDHVQRVEVDVAQPKPGSNTVVEQR